MSDNNQQKNARKKNEFKFVLALVYISLLLLIITVMVILKQLPEVAADENSSEALVSWETEEKPIPEIDLNDWRLMLVNADNPLPDNYEPQLSNLSNGLYFDSRAISYLNDMLNAAADDGYDLIVCSAYRTIEYQSELFEEQVFKQQNESGLDYKDAIEAAMTVVAYPGYSEHNLGLAADIVTPQYQMLDDGFAKTKESEWLKENCAKFGFILRYPQDKTDITGIIYESWHFRFVGEEAATYIMKNNLCLEEYLEISK